MLLPHKKSLAWNVLIMIHNTVQTRTRTESMKDTCQFNVQLYDEWSVDIYNNNVIIIITRLIVVILLRKNHKIIVYIIQHQFIKNGE